MAMVIVKMIMLLKMTQTMIIPKIMLSKEVKKRKVKKIHVDGDIN